MKRLLTEKTDVYMQQSQQMAVKEDLIRAESDTLTTSADIPDTSAAL